MFTSENDVLTSLISRVFRIDSITWGDPAARKPGQTGYVARFQGKLLEDSQSAYDKLAEALRGMNITPLFRIEKGEEVILLAPGIINPKPSNPWINVLFFLLTVISVLVTFAVSSYAGSIPPANIQDLLVGLTPAIQFTVALLSILLAHEFGHYLVSRYHKTAATLPYFVPLPLLSPFGTMGAVIIQKEPHKNKRILLDIGMAGPLAGMVVAVPVLLLGLTLSHVEALPRAVPTGQFLQMEGNSLLYLLAKYLIFHQWLPSPESFGNLPPLLYWIKYFFTGTPFPFGGMDVMIHPIAFAGWAGLLVTALNLVPAGQLDGGHIIHGILGDKASKLIPYILAVLVLLGLFWPGWWLWALLIFFLGRSYAEPLDQITQLDPARRALAVACLVIFFLVFTPIPLVQIM